MRLSLAVLLALGCAGPSDTQPSPPPVEGAELMLLEASGMSPGDPLTLSVDFANPGDRVYFGYSIGGLGSSPPLSSLGDLTLDIPQPQLVPGANPVVADMAGRASVTFTIPGSIPSGFQASVQAAVVSGAASYTSNPLVLEVDGCAEDENEDNDTPATASIVRSGERWHGRSCGGDVDWYRLEVDQGTVDIELDFDHLDGDLDLFLFDGTPTDTTSLYNEAVAISDSTTSVEEIIYDVNRSTTLYVAVLHYTDGLNGPGNNYDIDFLSTASGNVFADEPAPISPADLRADFDATYPTPPLLVDDMIDRYLAIEDAILADDIARARTEFDALPFNWSDPAWLSANHGANGINVGSPVGYYGLRMMEEIITYREANDWSEAEPVRMTVVMPDCAQGIVPTTDAELQAGMGTYLTQTLNPEVRDDDHRILRQSLRLFRRYMEAAADGAYSVEVEFVHLPNSCVDISATPFGTNGVISRPNSGSSAIWDEVPDEIEARSDWYLLVYPSMTGFQFPGVANKEWVTGGQTTYGGKPLILTDERWFTDKPTHLGTGRMTDLERRMYLPQWLQHEMFHYLFSQWPQFNLEVNGHDWFNRSTWPSDFVGTNEPDYYAEALHRRIQGASPSMGEVMRHVDINQTDWAKISDAEMTGTYVRLPETNGFHRGTLERTQNAWRWTNSVGVTWDLSWDASAGEFNPLAPLTAPYGDTPFYLELEHTPTDTELIGFRFQGELYSLQ